MRINFYGGPGVGKSTVAPYIFSKMKVDGYKVELVREYIKKWAYLGRAPKGYDQIYIFGHQLQSEEVFLQNGMDHIVTDSPIMLQVYYAMRHGFACSDELLNIAKSFDEDYASIDICLERGMMEYQEEGRYESKEEALQVDAEMKKFLQSNLKNCFFVDAVKIEEIYDLVRSSLE